MSKQQFKIGDQVVYEGQLCTVTEATQEWIYDLKAVSDEDVCSEFYAIPDQFVYPAIEKKRVIEILKVLEENEKMLRSAASHTSSGDKDADAYHTERINAIKTAIAAVRNS